MARTHVRKQAPLRQLHSCEPVNATPALAWQEKAIRTSVLALFDNARLNLHTDRWPVFLLMYYTCQPLSERGEEQGKISPHICVYSGRMNDSRMQPPLFSSPSLERRCGINLLDSR